MILALALALAQVEVLFSEADGRLNLTEALVARISAAESSVDVAAANLTSEELAQTLAAAARRLPGRVRVVLDAKAYAYGVYYTHENERMDQGAWLEANGVPVRFAYLERGSMHHNYLVVDGREAVTGSFGWSRTADRANYEYLVPIRDERVARMFAERFEALWRRLEPPGGARPAYIASGTYCHRLGCIEIESIPFWRSRVMPVAGSPPPGACDRCPPE